MTKRELLYEGKAKRIYATEDDNRFIVSYKDAATAFNGEKKAEIKGKGRLNNEISSLLFTKLASKGIQNHFVERLSETEQLVRKVTIIPIEVVVRNIVAGTLSKRLGIEEGTAVPEPITEYYLKNDELGDPLINEDHIRFLKIADKAQLDEMKKIALEVNTLLQAIFTECGVRLVDFKLEFGFSTDGSVLLADEISPDTCRLWDLHTNERFDKDLFRRELGSLTQGYEEIFKRLGGYESCTK
ncbi:phosphoribosylaminoimidazolesuccinocarboxamide synthase [Bacillus lacus]|uniref:Phosphoribosylaminoimidazole-succinocarboxamide synthase n=1 Tax=Metabacillus lacus TaxID=1983721 RepID=A0A7X2LZ98_9BACI|nr:phosphoribosylaminoimidazolesuccinocarboxamide synthase [Metabacillus lacus]